MTLLYYLATFIVVIGILVTVHEFGHYWVARRLGVKILTFAVGFGKPLWSRRFGKDQTEFVIASIPLGGYVKMLDEREGEVATQELSRAFNRQPLKVRTAIVVAGPLFNFLFAIIAYTFMYVIGVEGMKALVGEVTPQGLAEQAGFQVGDQIIAVNDQPAKSWETVLQITLHQLLNEQPLITYSVQAPQSARRDLVINLQRLSIDDIAEGQLFNKLGLQPFRPPWPAVMGKIVANSAAEQAGLQSGDQIIALDNQPITDWQTWASYVRERPGQTIQATVERHGQAIELTLIPQTVNGKGKVGVYAPYFVTEHYPLWTAVTKGIAKTWEISTLTLQIMAKMLTLQISSEHISGPISIAQFAGQSAQLGFDAFLSFLGLVSVSLGVINLLPIPLLDGGHLLLYFIEWIKGNPVTERTEYLLQRLGLTLLLSLMGLALFNDLGRLLN
jgi:regulator of sigma E protease